MYESISKNNELENEMTLNLSYFWYSDEVIDKIKMIELHGTVTALVETNVNWRNFTFHDKWESLLQRCYV